MRDRRRRRRRRRRWRKRENTRFSRRHGAEVQAAAVIVQFAGKGKYRRILGAKGDWHGSRGGTSNAQKSRLENWRRDETWSKGAFTWSIVSARMPPTFLPTSVYDLARCQLYIDSAVIKKKEQPYGQRYFRVPLRIISEMYRPATSSKFSYPQTTKWIC